MGVMKPASADKAYLRDYFTEQRKRLCENPQTKEALDAEIQTRLLISPAYRAADTILVYMARPFEIATSMIIFAALANHKTVALPVCFEQGEMIFRRIGDLSDLAPGRYGILEPKAACEKIVPDAHSLCVCPALSCDMRGYRLGFGGGYYDRYLEGFQGVKAALCYADSLIPLIEADDFDIKMNVIHTDSFSRYCDTHQSK